MRTDPVASLRSRITTAILAVGFLSAGATIGVADTLAPAVQPAPTLAPAPAAPGAQTDAAGPALSTDLRIVVVQWKIKKGHEQEFLDYWSTRSPIPDRTGLVAEFMSKEENRDQFPWINWSAAESGDYTTFYNIGLWRSSDDFMGQIGKYIDNKRPPMAFEAEHRERIFLAPLRWRIGAASLPAKDADGVK